MFPEAFRRRIKLQQYINTDSLIEGLSAPSPVSIRTNPEKWKYQPLDPDPVPWCGSGFYLARRPSFTLDPLFHAGCYYPQEASSMFLEEVFRQIAGNHDRLKVLDLCGAPGGKSTHLSSLIGRNGLLVANEVIGSRAVVLAENITKWGLSNTMVTRNDPSAFTRIPGFFDIILVDAPCSGEGMFSDPEVVKEWSAENAFLCSERQKRILMDVWPALKEEGILIYSTCTFNPDENEKNIKWLLQNKNAEPVRLDISEYEGITEIDYEGIFGYGLYPGRIKGEGLFISVLRKTEKTGSKNFKVKSGKRLSVSNDERHKIRELSDFSEDSLIKTGNNIIALPVSYGDYLILSENLRIVRSGTKICTMKSQDLIPSHELALSINIKLNVFNTLNVSPEQALSFLRRDTLSLDNMPAGWILLRYNGVNLGFIKNIGNRINNYYPVEWRIRMRVTEKDKENLINWRTK
jgi:16S rRNA C967 or C1407 C5-methylase (RsmB/RsmF family)/NOL1/NOP2/fmu family ribosome biogenesis protein